MKLQQIKYLLSVVEAGSISEAARNEYVSQSSISSAIKNLEDQYGITIFNRTSKGVVLTRQGRELLIDLEQVLYMLQLIDNKYSRNRSKSQRFCVSSQHHIGSIDAFLKLFDIVDSTSYRLGYLECKTQEVLENVERGISDIGVIYYTERSKSAMMQELRMKDLIFNHITYQKHHVYLGKGHPLCNKALVNTWELSEYPFVTYDQVVNSTTIFTEPRIRNYDVSRVIYVDDRAAAYSIIKSTNAYLIGTGYNKDDKVVTISIQDEDHIEIGWITKNNFVPSDICEQYIKFVEGLF